MTHPASSSSPASPEGAPTPRAQKTCTRGHASLSRTLLEAPQQTLKAALRGTAAVSTRATAKGGRS